MNVSPNNLWTELAIFQELVFGVGLHLGGHQQQEMWSRRSSPRFPRLWTSASPAWPISVLVCRWELQLFAGDVQRWDTLSSQPPAFSILLTSYVPLVSKQHGRAVPRDLPAQPQRAPLLQDLSYELLKTTASRLAKPRKTGKHQPASFTPLGGGYAKTIFPRHNQSKKR